MKTAFIVIAMLVMATSVLYVTATEQMPPIPTEEQPEVLTRGPVHEAFAEPVNLEIQAGLVAPKRPPANIEEIPPSERPEGEGFYWVPGYWCWDRDRDDYIWVSACWRAIPPNMSWVPGYWSPVGEGWEWIPGFWTPATIQEIEYLPAPPEFDDMQPYGSPPSSNYIWVPPCHYWIGDHYVVRRGYWLRAQQNWVWVPSHYTWTPRGYVFVAGHWDYPLERRGVLFAPVYFPNSVYRRDRFSYTPTIVINIGQLQVNLFTYPRYCHYYFGDYYDDVYLNIGIYPSFEVAQIRTWYDPIYVHDRWRHRDDSRWEENERHHYDLLQADRNLRPARTYREMETRLASLPEKQRKSVHLAEPLTVVVASKRKSMKFERIGDKTQKDIVIQGTAAHKFREERTHWETEDTSVIKGKPTTTTKETVESATEPKEKVKSTTERKEKVKVIETKGKKITTTYVPPREIHITKPEKVKITPPPIINKSVKAKKGYPSLPENENKNKDSQNEEENKNKGKGKGKGKGN